MGDSFARLQKPQGVSSIIFDAANRLTGFGGAALSYDLNGNLLNDGINSYTWNARRQLLPPDLQMDLGKSRADRFGRILAIRAAGDVLRVHERSQIARTRALFERFSDESGNRETEVWSKTDLNPRPRLRLSFVKLSATLAQYSALKRSSSAGENFIARNSPRISEPFRVSGPHSDTGRFARYLTLISAHQDWLQRRTRAMCVAVRTWTPDGRPLWKKPVRQSEAKGL